MAYTRPFVHQISVLNSHAAGDGNKVCTIFYANEAVANLTVSAMADADITQNDANYFALELNSQDGAGGGLTPMMTEVTTKSTGGVDINAGTKWTPTLTTSTLAAGTYMVLEVTETNGVAVAGLTFLVKGNYVQT